MCANDVAAATRADRHNLNAITLLTGMQTLHISSRLKRRDDTSQQQHLYNYNKVFTKQLQQTNKL